MGTFNGEQNVATRAEIEELIIRQARLSADYRRELMQNPRAVVERQVGKLPDNIRVESVEEGANELLLRLPFSVDEGTELSDEDLECVAGGKNVNMDKVNCAGAGMAIKKGGFASKALTISIK